MHADAVVRSKRYKWGSAGLPRKEMVAEALSSRRNEVWLLLNNLDMRRDTLDMRRTRLLREGCGRISY
jgi:hypothetical protein